MRKAIKRWVSPILIPATRWYLRKPRTYRYEGIFVKVMPGVFHPGLFSSTRFLLSYLKNQNVKGKTMLELGCGTALISIFSALRGAVVTASDLNPTALENAKTNAEINRVNITFVLSDLFEKIDRQTFDWVVVNPPYYPREAKNPEELAWHCGEDFEYFRNFFQGLRGFTNSKTEVVMVLTAGCDLQAIFKIASTNGITAQRIATKKVFFDGEDYLFRLKPGQEAQVE